MVYWYTLILSHDVYPKAGVRQIRGQIQKKTLFRCEVEKESLSGEVRVM